MTAVSRVSDILDVKVRDAIKDCKFLVVGAGGIGCEILKNLALSGFKDIEIIDLDTIDVSNLNRQFLFRKEHVGKPKAIVARESVLKYTQGINIKAYHDSITTPDYGVTFFKKFKMVFNALDNRAARNHVNRMCLAADVPLLESGTEGYLGQVELIQKGVTKCYECSPKPRQKTFPGCTIRNTPSEPVHCIVWSKHLFNQLFGEEDADENVSPDTADPEAAGDAGTNAMEVNATETGNVERKSTKKWAQEIAYDPAALFDKFFSNDIKYLLSMEKLWKTRRAPVPLTWKEAKKLKEVKNENSNSATSKLENMQMWSIAKCAQVFADSLKTLLADVNKGDSDVLVWDKDYAAAMDFVSACSNIRSHIFGILRQTPFCIKSIAGSIIPAIATTNAIVAGLVIMVAFRVLAGQTDYSTVYIRRKAKYSKNVLLSEKIVAPPNPKCYVCSAQPYVQVALDVDTMLVGEFESLVLKQGFNMIAPDVILEGKNVVLISSEEGETTENNDKKLTALGVTDGAILKAEDFLQNFAVSICIMQSPLDPKADSLFKIMSDDCNLKAKPDGVAQESKNGSSSSATITSTSSSSNSHGECSTSGSSKPSTTTTGDDDDDAVEMTEVEGPSSKKRKLNNDSDDDMIVLDDVL